MRLAELTGRRVALLGLGADVRAAVPAIRAVGPATLVAVEEGPAADASDVPVVALDEAAADAEVFVRSPGFPRYLPPLQDALARGAAMTTPLDLWMGTIGPERTVIGVTGTKGKSTVTDLVGSFAEAAGLRVGVAGNLGPPVFSGEWDGEAPVVVLEISSYQAADLHHVPDVAVVTFLSEDHLSWHGGLDRYLDDKLRVVRNESGVAPRILVPPSGSGGRVAERLEGFALEEVSAPDVPSGRVVPRHRLQNAALAAAAVTAVGGRRFDDGEVLEAAASSLPGRLDVCDGPDGVLCVDDALASNPSATAAGLAWLRGFDLPTVVLLGGADRGVDPAPLAAEARAWPAGRLVAVGLPVSGEGLAATCGIPLAGRAGTVADAVGVALAHLVDRLDDRPGDRPASRDPAGGASSPEGLTALGPDGPQPGAGAAPDGSEAGPAFRGVVVFSPAAPTPADIGTWATRSEEFRAALLRRSD